MVVVIVGIVVAWAVVVATVWAAVASASYQDEQELEAARRAERSSVVDR